MKIRNDALHIPWEVVEHVPVQFGQERKKHFFMRKDSKDVLKFIFRICIFFLP